MSEVVRLSVADGIATIALNRLVALKMVLGGPHAGSTELDRFHREAEAVAGLRHPNIVQVYDIDKVDGRPYFALEYADAGSLAGQLRGDPQALLASARMVETLARAVHHAHEHGIIHRDLKPANIKLVQVSAADAEAHKKLVEGAVLAGWAKRCGNECAKEWNDTVGKALGLKAPTQ